MKDGRDFKNARTTEMQTLDYVQSVLLSCRDQAAGDRHVMLAYLMESSRRKRAAVGCWFKHKATPLSTGRQRQNRHAAPPAMPFASSKCLALFIAL